MEERLMKAVLAKKEMALLESRVKNEVLLDIASTLINHQEKILLANKIDLANAKMNHYHSSFVDRLELSGKRIQAMVDGLVEVSKLDDPIGRTLESKYRPNGLLIVKKTVALGVIGVIYESRPNVTVDTFALCFKSGNVSVLRGGKEAIETNKVLVHLIHQVLEKHYISQDVLIFIEDTRRESAKELMKMAGYLDLLIPRGSASLIETVKKESKVPVIETGSGVCHLYVDKEADIDMAVKVAYNAKVDRPAVCNSIETILVDETVKVAFLDKLAKSMKDIVVFKGCPKTKEILKDIEEAKEEDYYKEYDDLFINIKVTSSLTEAIDHINTHSTHHSETIISSNDQTTKLFFEFVDSAVVYQNASTRFSDGFEFGYGAEVGISTQKLHARGPMGLFALTTTKYYVYGSGQIRKTS